jgi:molybdate transport system substrate-binding protein
VPVGQAVYATRAVFSGLNPGRRAIALNMSATIQELMRNQERRFKMWNRIIRYGAVCVGLMLIHAATVGPTVHAGEKNSITVFAAASTTNAITDIAKLFQEKTKVQVKHSFASSSTLARQIAQGAPADVYLSANPKWMNYLAEKKAIEPESRFDLLGNRIVLIAPKDSTLSVTITPGLDLAALLGNEKIAMGDPAHVPAGMYAKAALEKLGMWKNVAAKVARSKDVRAALALVARGEAPLGIVYATDAAISQKVKVVAVFPENSHPKIVYPVALVKGKGTREAKSFLKFLTSAEATEVFRKYGFTVRK